MDIIQQIRTLLDQLVQNGGAPAPVQPLLPQTPDPRPSMPLSEDGKYFTAPWWMEGYVGALAGVRLSDWNSEQFLATVQSGGIPQHFRVLVPKAGQAHVSPADLGWMDASRYDPDNYATIDARRAAWIEVGCPTVGARGKFDVHGGYIKPGAWAFSPQS